MSEVPSTITAALREQRERISAAVRDFLEQANARGIKPDPFGHIVYKRERGGGLPPETIRVTTEGVVHYEGEASSLESGFANGLPFYVMDGTLHRGAFPPPEVVGDGVPEAAVREAGDFLIDVLTRYLDAGSQPPPATPRGATAGARGWRRLFGG